jgi:putative two-component system response regulator
MLLERMKSRILYLDDQAAELEFLQRAMHFRAGIWDLQFEIDPDRAWDRLRDDWFDIFVCDARMQQSAGIRLLGMIRQDSRLIDLPVIVVLEKDDLHAKIVAFDQGATDWLAKPLDEHDFAFRVRNVMRLAQLERQLKAFSGECSALA